MLYMEVIEEDMKVQKETIPISIYLGTTNNDYRKIK